MNQSDEQPSCKFCHNYLFSYNDRVNGFHLMCLNNQPNEWNKDKPEVETKDCLYEADRIRKVSKG